MVAVKAASFDRPELPRGGELIMEGTYGRLTTLATHPLKSELVVSGDEGVLWGWNYATKQLLRTRKFDTLRLSHLQFSVDGTKLAVGCTNGTLRILDPVTLQDVQVT
jgi:WD40 repeat protein